MNLSTREQAYTALGTLLQTVSGIVTFTRRLKLWQTVAPEAQPALYLEHTGEQRIQIHGLPGKVILEANLWLYVKAPQGDTVDGTSAVGPALNPLLDAIDVVFNPNNSGEHTLTLGGLVHHCWIEGQTQIFEGDLGDEAVAIIPVKLLVT